MVNTRNLNNRLAGINPFSYVGVEPYTPPDLIRQTETPTSIDSNFNIGTIWLVEDPVSIWMLVDLSQGEATWVKLYPNGGGGGANEFPCNIGVASQASGILNVFGQDLHVTTGAGNTVDIELSNGTDGQLIIGGGSAPIWNDLIGIEGIVITTGANSITISSDDGGGLDAIATDNGTADPSDGSVAIIGDNLITTSAYDNNVIIALERSEDGQIPIGATGGPTKFAHITSPDNSVFITNLPNEIRLELETVNCCFFAVQIEDTDPVTGDALSSGPPYRLGSNKTLYPLYDLGNNFDGGDGRGGAAKFTAPTTGVYWFVIRVAFYNIVSSSQNAGAIGIFTNNTSIPNLKSSGTPAVHAYNCMVPSSPTYLGLSAQVTMQLDEGESINFQGIINSYTRPVPSTPRSVYIGGQTVDGEYQTYVGGYLVMAIT